MVQLQRQAVGEEHPDYATSLDNLASLYTSMGAYAFGSCRLKKENPEELDIKVEGPDSTLTLIAQLYRITRTPPRSSIRCGNRSPGVPMNIWFLGTPNRRERRSISSGPNVPFTATKSIRSCG